MAEQIQGHIGYKDVKYLEEFVNDEKASASDNIVKEEKEGNNNTTTSTEDHNNSNGSIPSTNGDDNISTVSSMSSDKSKTVQNETVVAAAAVVEDSETVVATAAAKNKKMNNRGKKRENKGGKSEEKSTADENCQDISVATKDSKAGSPTQEANTGNNKSKPKKNKKKQTGKSSKASTPAPEAITSPIESPEQDKPQPKQLSIDENDAEDEGEEEDISKFYALKKNAAQSGRIINVNIGGGSSSNTNTINTLIDDDEPNFHTASDSETIDKDFVTIHKYSKKKREQFSQKRSNTSETDDAVPKLAGGSGASVDANAPRFGYKSSTATVRGYESEREYNPNRGYRKSSFASQTYSSSMYTISKAGDNNRQRGINSSTATSKSESLAEADHLMPPPPPLVEESAGPKVPSYADIAKAARAAKAAEAAAAAAAAVKAISPVSPAEHAAAATTTISVTFGDQSPGGAPSSGHNGKPANCVAGGSKGAIKPVATSSVAASSVSTASSSTLTATVSPSPIVSFINNSSVEGGERVDVASTSSRASLSSVSLPSAYSSSSSSSLLPSLSLKPMEAAAAAAVGGGGEGKGRDHTVPVITQKDAASVVAFAQQEPIVVSFESKMSTSSSADKSLPKVGTKKSTKLILGNQIDDANYSPVTFDENVVPNGKDKLNFGSLNIKFYEDCEDFEMPKPSRVEEMIKTVCCCCCFECHYHLLICFVYIGFERGC